MFFEFWMRKGVSREHGVALGGVVDEDRHDCGCLLQVLFRKAFEGVLVGVRAAGFVVARILDELKSGKADFMERNVIGGAAVAQSDGGKAKIAKGGRPCWKMAAVMALPSAQMPRKRPPPLSVLK